MKSLSTSKPKCEPAAVAQVIGWLIEGESEHDISEAIRAGNLGDEKALTKAATATLAQAGRFNPDVVIGFCFHAYRDLFRRMVEIADFAGALRAVKLIEDLAVRQRQRTKKEKHE